MKKFTNPNDPENVQLKSTLKRWISEKLVLSQEAVIEIEEHNCTEVSCVYAETVFTIKNTPDVSGQVEGGTTFHFTIPQISHATQVEKQVFHMQE